MESNTLNAANTIRGLIVSGDLGPNKAIDIGWLCRHYDWQKVHVAEACATLENEGFITYSPQGPVVRQVSDEEIAEWLNKRFSLELDIVEKLASELDEAKLAVMKQDMQEQEKAVQSGDVVKFLRLNAGFHSHLADLAGFPTAAHWFELESIRLKISEIKALDTPSKFRNCFEEHEAIVNSLQSRQPKIARNAMKLHLERTAERISTKDVDSLLTSWLTNQGFPLHGKITINNSFVPAVRINDLIFVSSATPMRVDGTEVKGKVGSDIDVATAKEAACLCLAHSLSLLRDTVGEPLEEKIVRAIDLTFFINAIPTFDNHSDIADAGSNLLIGGLGPKGEHSRSAIGVGSLVRNVSVVLKAVYQIKI